MIPVSRARTPRRVDMASKNPPKASSSSYPELKPEVAKSKKPFLMNLLEQGSTHPGTSAVGQKVRAGKMGDTKKIIANRMAQHWTAKKPNLPDMGKIAEMLKEDNLQLSEEGTRVLKEMKKRFDKAMKKADLGGPEVPELFKNFEDLAASLHKWKPGRK